MKYAFFLKDDIIFFFIFNLDFFLYILDGPDVARVALPRALSLLTDPGPGLFYKQPCNLIIH